MIEGCKWCDVSLYDESEKTRGYSCMGSKIVYCADNDACRARIEERKARERDLCEDQRLSAGNLTRDCYTI